MSVDTAALEIKVDSGKLTKGTKDLDSFEKQAKKTEKATDGLNATFKSLVGPVVALVSVTALAQKLIAVTREFDVLNAGLITATKSSVNAAEAFEALQEFAQKTPYDLQQAVKGFTQLVNLGLTPSEKALTSYGNTASAMGKDLNQMIEAVADAATGEFERLKEFGIKAKVEGDNIGFVFQGVKTSVKNNAAEIEKYLMALGENQFAGAMQRRMETLDGSLANLEDNWDSLFRNVSQSGVGEIIKQQADLASEALDELNTMFKSGEMDAYLKASAIGWRLWGKDVTDSITIVDGFINDTWGKWGSDAKIASKGLYLGFKEFPVEIRAYFQEAAVEAIAFVDRLVAQGAYAKDAIAAVFSDDTLDQARKRYNERYEQSNQVREAMIDDISQEKDAQLAAIDEQIAAGQELRTEYEKQLEARRKLNEDRLAQYKVGGDPASGGEELSSAEKKKAEAKAKQQKKEFEDLVASLNTEEESIAASYEKRKAIIEKNTAAESTARSNLMARLDKDHQKELDDLHEIESALEKRKRLITELQEVEESTWTESQKAAAAYQKQIETLWQAQQIGLIGQQQHEEAVSKVTEAYEKQQEKTSSSFIDMEELSKQAARNTQDAFADFLFDPFAEGIDGMLLGFIKVVQRMAAEAAAAQLTKALFGSAGGGEGSGWLGALFSVGASALGGMWGGAAGATAAATAGGAATGASNFASGFDASAGSVSFPGRASGGSTVGGQMYEVGERGPELYNRNGRSFLVDSQAGNVTPMSPASSGGSGVNLSMTFNIDNRGQDTGGSANEDNNQANQFGNIMKGVALKTIHEELQPGGSLWNQEANRNG